MGEELSTNTQNIPNLLNPFEYQKPDENGIIKIEIVRSKCKELYDIINQLSPSRERALAITKLEEVSMWANKCIVFNK